MAVNDIDVQQGELEATARFDAPIPGMSLTNNPDTPYPFEAAPEYVALMPALEYIWTTLLHPTNYVPVMKLLGEEVPVMDVVRSMLFVGFNEGKWNPDLMTILIEPVAYMLIALGERLDLDMVIYEGEMEDEDETEEILGVQFEEEKIKSMERAIKQNTIPEGILTQQMQADLESLPPVDLTTSEEPTQEEEEVEPTAAPEQSLMARPTE
jgi:hypothetical protein